MLHKGKQLERDFGESGKRVKVVVVTRNHFGILNRNNEPRLIFLPIVLTLSIQFFVYVQNFWSARRKLEEAISPFFHPFVYGKKESVSLADEQGMEGVGGWENLQTALLQGRGVGEKKRGCWPGGTGRLINFSGLETRFQTFSDFYLLLDPRRNRNERNGTIVNLFRSCGRKFIERNTNIEGISNHFISIIFISVLVFS